jgi:hypothetical protein
VDSLSNTIKANMMLRLFRDGCERKPIRSTSLPTTWQPAPGAKALQPEKQTHQKYWAQIEK